MPDRRAVLALAALVVLPAYRMESNMPTKPTIARIWRGRTRRDVADTYEHYVRAEGIPPLEKTALGVQLLREDREEETWFTTLSYWADMSAMSAFTKGEPTKVHHLDRDPELLIELPQRIEIHRILVDEQGLR
ncbi:MAG: hypothetical protein JF570_03885 [Caulobacter sp.]|jgi:hypothetical protein|nr:hypothetical protein [Caulobacter sp.]